MAVSVAFRRAGHGVSDGEVADDELVGVLLYLRSRSSVTEPNVDSVRVWDVVQEEPLDLDMRAVEVLRRYGRPEEYDQSAIRFMP